MTEKTEPKNDQKPPCVDEKQEEVDISVLQHSKAMISNIEGMAETFSSIKKLRKYTNDLHKAANIIELLHGHNKRLRRQLRKIDPDNSVLRATEIEISGKKP